MVKFLTLLFVCVCSLGIATQTTLAHPEEPAHSEPQTPETTVVEPWVIEYEEKRLETVVTTETVTQTVEHTVVWGDTLSKLAQTYLGTMESYPTIAQRNQIPNPHFILVGQVLAIDITTTVTHETQVETIVPRQIVVPVTDKSVTLNTTETAVKPANPDSGEQTNTTMTFSATAYSCSLAEGTAHFVNGTEVCNTTANGSFPTWGMVAVDPTVIPLGTQLQISGFEGVVFTATDTGGAIKGNRLDIWFPTYSEALKFGRRSVEIQIVPPETEVVAARAPSVSAAQSEGWIWPTTLWKLSDTFGTCRSANCKQVHEGIDMDLYPYRDTHAPIVAARSGTVTVSTCVTGSFGCYIVIDHGDGFTSLYAHLSRQNVSVGQKVARGENLGLSGVTGYTTGEHLHFEIHQNGVPIDPLLYLN